MIIGWDVSTSAIGVCVRNNDGTTQIFNVIFPVGETHAEKHLSAAKQIKDFFAKEISENSSLIVHYIEDCLGGFTGGLTTKQTLMKLASMNAIVTFILQSYGTVVHLPPVTTKSITKLKVPKGGDKKIEVIKLVMSREPTFPYAETAAGNYVKGTDDMADAWLLAEAGLKIMRGEAEIGRKKQIKGNRGKTRNAKGDSPSKRGVRIHVPRKARRSVLECSPEQSETLGKSGDK